MFSINKYSALAIYLITLIILLVFYLFVYVGYYNVLIERNFLLLAVFLFVVFYFTRERSNSINKQFFRPSLLFLIGYCIVFFQYHLDLVLNIRALDSPYSFSSATINKSIILAVIGLCCFFIGYLSYNKNYVSTQKYKGIVDIRILKAIYIFSSILYVLCHFQLAMNGVYSQAALEAQAGSIVNYSEILQMTVYISLLAFSVKNLKIKEHTNVGSLTRYLGFWIHFCIVIVALNTLLMGDRGAVIITVLSYGFAIVLVSRKKVGFKSFFLLIIMSAIIVTLLGIIRSRQTASTKEIIEFAISQKSVVPFTGELASSVNTFIAALDYVPEKHDYLYGSFQVRSILDAIPFSSRVVSNFVAPEKYYKSSAFFCTYIIQGDFYTYGNGTCLLADLYLSFGLLGIVIGMWFVGYIIRKVEYGLLESKEPSLTYITIGLYFVAYAIYENRASLLTPLNFIVFSLLLNTIYQIISRKRLVIK